MAANQVELGAAVADKLRPMFADLGLALESFQVQNISLPDELQKRLDERIGMGVVGDMGRYTQFQTAQSIPVAAANEGGVAGAGAGLGAGIAMGQAMGQAMSQAAGGAPAGGAGRPRRAGDPACGPAGPAPRTRARAAPSRCRPARGSVPTAAPRRRSRARAATRAWTSPASSAPTAERPRPDSRPRASPARPAGARQVHLRAVAPRRLRLLPRHPHPPRSRRRAGRHHGGPARGRHAAAARRRGRAGAASTSRVVGRAAGALGAAAAGTSGTARSTTAAAAGWATPPASTPCRSRRRVPEPLPAWPALAPGRAASRSAGVALRGDRAARGPRGGWRGRAAVPPSRRAGRRRPPTCAPPTARFATLDYSDDAPRLYTGEVVELAALGLRGLREFDGWR